MSLAVNVAEVGAEVEAMCNKCKAPTAHIVTVVKDDQVKKVMCKSCEGTHKFVTPEEARAKIAAKKAAEASGTAKKKTTATKTSKTKEQRRWTRLCGKTDIENPVDYSIDKTFKLMDAIQHKKFGLGIVEEVESTTKIIVSFEEGSKPLAQNRV